jgi:hypothetical protein
MRRNSSSILILSVASHDGEPAAGGEEPPRSRPDGSFTAPYPALKDID